jgi:hypothetical protein
MRERHRQIGLAFGALVLVLLENGRVEGPAPVVERVEAFAEAGNMFALGQRQAEAHPADPTGSGEDAHRAGDDPGDAVRPHRMRGIAPAQHGAFEPARVLHRSVAAGGREPVAQGLVGDEAGQGELPPAGGPGQAGLRGGEVPAVDGLAAGGPERRSQLQCLAGGPAAEAAFELAGDGCHITRRAHTQRQPLARDRVHRPALLGVHRVRVARAEWAVPDHRFSSRAVRPSSTASRMYIAWLHSRGCATGPQRCTHSSRRDGSSR